MEWRLRENIEYNLQVQEYYKQREEQRDVTFAQQQAALQVSMSLEKKHLEQLILCITNKLNSHAYFQQQDITFPQVQLLPLQPPLLPQSWMHHMGYASAKV
jgi:hypothetical protein